MNVVSVNVGLPRQVTYRGRTYPTAIFKAPVAGRVRCRRLNIDGDAQGNPRTHGGPDMAVYAFGHENYAHWERDLGLDPLPFGAFGENLTVTGLFEDEVAVGDVFHVGTARLQATEPRTPCHKLAMKFDDSDLPRRFALQGNVGFYFRVLTEGEIGAGDEIVCESRDPARVTLAEILRLWADRNAAAGALDRALALPALSASWRERFAKRRAAQARAAASVPAADRLEWDGERLTWA